MTDCKAQKQVHKSTLDRANLRDVARILSLAAPPKFGVPTYPRITPPPEFAPY
jgi:hypothetical protein